MAIKPIKINADLIAKLNKRKYSKIRYWKNKPNYEFKNFLPEFKSTGKLLKELEKMDRRDVNDWIRETTQFLKKNNMQGVEYYGQMVPKFYKHEVTIQLNRQKRINKPKPSIYSGTLYTLEAENELPLKTIDLYENVDYLKYLNDLKSRNSFTRDSILNKIYVENFKQAMINNGYPDEYREAIEKYLNSIDANLIFQQGKTNPNLHIRFVYDNKINPEVPKLILNEFVNIFGLLKDVDASLLEG